MFQGSGFAPPPPRITNLYPSGLGLPYETPGFRRCHAQWALATLTDPGELRLEEGHAPDLYPARPTEGQHIAACNKTSVKYNGKLMSLFTRLDEVPCFMSCVLRKQSTDHHVEIDDELSMDCMSLDHVSEPAFAHNPQGGGEVINATGG